MYFLWQGKPAAVLSKSGEWIPKREIPDRLEEVRMFENAGEARYVQRSKYSRKGVSVLGEKSFKDKTGIKKMPVFREATVQAKNDNPASEHAVTYCEYLDVLCEGDGGQSGRVIFPPANQELTIQTPLIQETEKLLLLLEEHLAKAEDQELRLGEEIRQLDLLISDRLHQSELYELSPDESISFAKDLHETQIERRRRKNEMFVLLVCKELLRQIELSEVKRAIREVESLGKQEYRCRILSENDPFVQAHADKTGRRT